ncbi:MAG: YbaN family protein [Lachnospirales bacterium]
MKYIFIIFGFSCVAIGALGVVMPILPTTPFLLLASFCFAKGSNKFNTWFKNTKLYKNNLESFEKNRTMTLKTKLCILIPVTLLLLIAFFMMNNIIGKITIIVLLVIKYFYFITKVRTIKTK